ncbi:MAG: thioredoxin family protein [Sulfolobaceae archaeon]
MSEYEEFFTEEVRTALAEALRDMKDPVDVYVFIDSNDRTCRYCQVTKRFLEFMSENSPKGADGKLLRVHVIDKAKDEKLFKEFNVERVPTVALLNGKIRWTGTPLGEEVRALVETIIRISQKESGLSETTKQIIRSKLNGEVLIETIVTPSCPYCPYAALMANMIAYESCIVGKCNVVSDIIEAYENQDIAEKYGVMSVPTMAINGSVEFIGVPYEENLIQTIIEKSNSGQ